MPFGHPIDRPNKTRGPFVISMITTGSMRGKVELPQLLQLICQPEPVIETSCPHLEQKREVFCQ